MEEFNELVASLMQRGIPRDRAVIQAAKQRPDLHKEFLLETNAGRGVDHLIESKFD